MTSKNLTPRLRDLEARALVAEGQIQHKQNDNRASLEATVEAAELYMQALRLVDNPRDKKRLDTKTRELIIKAEQLKRLDDGDSSINGSPKIRSRIEHPVSTRTLTTREKIILLEGSKLNGAIFKQWTAPPLDDEFDLVNVQDQWTDDFEFSLSETQSKHFDGWKRPKVALSHIRINKDGKTLPNEATMERLGTHDMVQDAAPDCSVVASICVGATRAEKGHRKLTSAILWPYDHNVDRPCISQNGRYVMRFYFNGCWRRVDVDDRLPISKSSRVLHIIDRSHPGLLWPSIVEKGYLKVRGGYDFPGSNSGTDIAVLSGWIPQQVFLHDNDLDAHSLWEELLPSFTRGEILCTLGTGKLGRREQQALGLGAEHDYAILDMKETGETREMLIKNPWAGGDVWKGATKCRPHPGHENNGSRSSADEQDSQHMKPGTFWMDFNHVFQYFENLYVNWDPSMFKYRQDMHFSWQLPEVVRAGNLFIDHPQFAVKANRAGECSKPWQEWLHQPLPLQQAWPSCLLKRRCQVRGPFVDSPNTLLRIQAQSRETYTVVVVGQDLPVGKHNFTISTFSNIPVDLAAAHETYRDPQTLNAAWSRSTAGGSSNSPRYLQNPQSTITVSADSNVTLVLRALSDNSPSSTIPNANIHVKLLITASDGRRITKLRQRDIVAQSGDYRRGSAVVETMLSKGSYTVICSTFEPNQFCKFQLDLYTTLEPHKASIRALPAEGSGRLSIMPEPVVFAGSNRRFVAHVAVDRMTKALWKASMVSGSSSSMFKMSLEQGHGPYRKTVASSSADEKEYNSIASGLRIEDLDLSASMTSREKGGLWLVVEKPAQTSMETSHSTILQIEVVCEERIVIGDWVPVEPQL